MKHTNCQTCKNENPVGFGLDLGRIFFFKILQKLWFEKGPKHGLDFVFCRSSNCGKTREAEY